MVVLNPRSPGFLVSLTHRSRFAQSAELPSEGHPGVGGAGEVRFSGQALRVLFICADTCHLSGTFLAVRLFCVHSQVWLSVCAHFPPVTTETPSGAEAGRGLCDDPSQRSQGHVVHTAVREPGSPSGMSSREGLPASTSYESVNVVFLLSFLDFLFL